MRLFKASSGLLGKGVALVLAIAVPGSVLTALLAAHLYRLERAEAQRDYEVAADEIASTLQRRVQAHAEVLFGLRGLIHSAGDDISREAFRRYVERWDPRVRLSAVQAVQFVRYLPAEAVEAHEQRVRADPQLDEAQRRAYRVQPHVRDAAHYVIDYTEPLAGNEKVLGFDLASRPTHRVALERGRDSGELLATERVILIQDPSGVPAFVMRLPVYRGPREPVDTTERRASLLGFVAVVYRVRDLLDGLFEASVTQRMRLVIHDAGFDDLRPSDWRPAAATLMYDSERGAPAPRADALLQRRIEVGGRRWQLLLQPRASRDLALAPGFVALGGGVVTLLAASLAVAWMRSRASAARLSALTLEQSLVFDNALAGIVQVRRRRIRRCNERFAAILGYASAELVGRDGSDLFQTPQAHADFEARARALRDAGQPMEFELALRRRDGAEVWCAMHGRVHEVEGERESIWVIEDLSARRAAAAQLAARNAAVAQANEELRQSVERLSAQKRLVELLGTMSTALQSCRSADEVAEVLERGLVALQRAMAGALYLLEPQSGVLQRARHWGGMKEAATQLAPQDCWALRRSRPHQGEGLALRCAHCDTSERTLCLPLLAMNEQVGLLCLSSDTFDEPLYTLILTASEQVAVTLVNLRMRERLHDQAVRDKLTGLYNRRFLDESLQRELARCRREASGLALLLIDIDHFKRFNDEHGHETGDQVLAAVGHCLGTQTRATDIPCRYGGEEFVVAMPRSGLQDAVQRAQALRSAIAALHLSSGGGQALRVTVSIGVAAFPTHGPDATTLLASADAALYAAKRAGRDRVCAAD